jgi:hypothetical protein
MLEHFYLYLSSSALKHGLDNVRGLYQQLTCYHLLPLRLQYSGQFRSSHSSHEYIARNSRELVFLFQISRAVHILRSAYKSFSIPKKLPANLRMRKWSIVCSRTSPWTALRSAEGILMGSTPRIGQRLDLFDLSNLPFPYPDHSVDYYSQFRFRVFIGLPILL